MRPALWVLAVALTACTSAEETAREREQQMIAQAQADSSDEAAFVADSLALLASVTLDSVRERRVREVRQTDDNGYEYSVPRHEAVGVRGQVCAVTVARYLQLVPGDTLRCQWGPPE